MTTINIHKDKLLPAAFAYQQRKLKEIDDLRESLITIEMGKRRFFIYPVNREQAIYRLNVPGIWYQMKWKENEAKEEYVKLQTACRVAEDGIVSLDIDVVQRIFGEE